MKKKNQFYIKLISVIAISFLIANFLNSEIFLASSPQVRPNLMAYLSGRVEDLRNDPKTYIASLFIVNDGKVKNLSKSEGEKIEKKFENIIKTSLSKKEFIPLGKGVYAKESDQLKYQVVKIRETELIEYSYTINGKEIKIYVNKGDIPPTKEEAKFAE